MKTQTEGRKDTFIVRVVGNYGRGQTLKTAVMDCLKNRAKGLDEAVGFLILNDDNASVSSIGNVLRAPDSECITLFAGIKLQVLLASIV
jgi:hypothetical protein